jgi:hypothetical protein
MRLDRDTILFHHGTGSGSASKNPAFTRQPQDVRALYGVMEHPAIRLIERSTINAPKIISGYVRIHSISSPSRYVKDILEIKTRKRRCRHNSTAKRCSKIYSIQNRPKIYREKVDFRGAW